MFLEKLKNIKAFILDVDGVLTNGDVTVTENGDQMRHFNVKDGYAINHAVKSGYYVACISGGRSQGVLSRLSGLGVKDVFLGISHKLEVYERVIADMKLKPEEILYMGDDIPDLDIMRKVGLPTCPADAVEEIKAVAAYISPILGGKGCVRDVIEKVLKIQDQWMKENATSF
ncbi:KdsC family phosphatase [Mucilaginibacter arboris]|uniref:HAD hydrolase family protein n=1 Tax=Mucilaginibacter arboris TaxID=2682090 RepID=A0A7K1SSR5_9SPHI|nr:HAD-IIIA family hydrolase [Mucilaginibacter arboris]MVN20352.1 HAD hydrolase family protein [Mucilaginibacter arboris]